MYKQLVKELPSHAGYDHFCSFRDERGHELHVITKDNRFSLVSVKEDGSVASFCKLWPKEIVEVIGGLSLRKL